MITINRSFSSLKRTTLGLALLLSPMILTGAECASDPFPSAPLAMNALRATVGSEGDFVSDEVTVSNQTGYWLLVAPGVIGSSERHIELRIPKETSVPFTVNVATSDVGSIYYCVPLTGTSCKNFYANKAQGGSGTITITNVSGVLEGTFKGTVQLANESETRTISSGEFKADI